MKRRIKLTIEANVRGTTWSLLTFQSEDKNGEIIYPLGKDAEGFIMVTPANHLSVHIMAADREKHRKDIRNVAFNTAGEKEMAEFGYHAYSGSVTIDEEGQTLTTHVKVSLLPDYIDTQQTRSVKIDGDKLYLSNVKHPERKLVWKKIG